MPTYLLAGAARVNGERYERGDELPEHEHTKALVDRGYASTNVEDLTRPEDAPSMVGGEPKATERSSVLVGDANGVHRETVTNSGDGVKVNTRDDATQQAAAEAGAAKTAAARRK